MDESYVTVYQTLDIHVL